ncbi:TPA: CXXX repeat peptide modification system protein [Clostridium botulinum]|nr:CXXX repeat peptide modification system protein [Clostridium botulinum]
MLVKIKNEETNIIQKLYDKIYYSKQLEPLFNKDEENWFKTKLSQDFDDIDKSISNWWQDITSKYNLDNTIIEKYYLSFEDSTLQSFYMEGLVYYRDKRTDFECKKHFKKKRKNTNIKKYFYKN